MNAASSLDLPMILDEVKQYCSFSLGIKAIGETEPSFDPLVIRRRHEYISEAMQASVHYGPMPFYGIRDIAEILNHAMKGSVLSPSDLVSEMQFIRGIKGILSYERSLTDIPHPALKELCDSMTVHLQTERKLASCINDYGEVMDSASSELRSIRAALRRADQEIASAAQRFVASHPDSVVDAIITERAGRAVILVKASEKNSFGGLVYGDSASGQASYIEPAALLGPNNRKQQLIESEREEISRILSELSSEVASVAREELANLETCTVLDSVFAKAEWGRAHEASAARLNEEGILRIVKAKHPLIDPKKVVANTYRLGDPQRTLLITGPNTGGKTVSMKIIGLFVLMTYAGMPVTAEEAEIPFFDQVFADIGDDQSVSESLSSFSAHISKQAEILKHATGNSLVLLDEVGSGTDPREGESLAISILNELRQRQCMTVATTHYSRLKAYGKRHSDILLASVQFDMEKLEPTYKYTEGLTGQSNAMAVAQKYGLPASIIKYADFLSRQAKGEEDRLIETLERQLNEAETMRESLNRQIEENRKEKEELRKERIRLEKEKDDLRQDAVKEAERYVEEARRQADEILRDMRETSRTGKYHEVLQKRNRLTSENAPEQPAAEVSAQSDDYQVGDAVELRSSGAVCEVTEVSKRELKVSLNGREIRVKRNQVRPSLHVIVHQKPEMSVSIRSGNIFSSMPSECNLIGMRVDEAREKFSSYMDQAKVHGLKTVRIIHGDGSGALRKMVHEALKKDKAVKEFRLGTPSEGSTGATVVVLN